MLSLCLLLAALLPATAPASSSPDPLPADSLIRLGKAQLDTAMVEGDADRFRRARSLFERAAERDTLPALSRYYAGLAAFRLVDYTDGDDGREAALDSAVRHLEAATERRPDWAEPYALLASAYGRKAAGGMIAGMRYGPQSSSALSTAKELAPDNPRVVLADGISTFQKPSLFGGDREAGFRKMKAAARLFANRSADPDGLEPSWGHAMTYAWIGIAHAKADRLSSARTAFNRALTLRPGLHWVEDVLLPEVTS